MARRNRIRGRQLERTLCLIRALETRRYGMSFRDMMKEFGVSRRTLYRDLAAVERSGIPLEKHGENGSRSWRIEDGPHASAGVPFTPTELLSLYFAMNLMAPFRGTRLREGLEDAIRKIEGTFGPRDRDLLAELPFTHVARPSPSKEFRRHAAVIGAVSRGCVEHRTLEISYRATAEEKAKTYRFRPYCLAYAGGELYTIGYSELRQSIRTLRVDRIERFALTSVTFERPKEFDPEEYLVKGFGMYAEGEPASVRIEFAKEAARAIRDKEWHPSQRIEERGGKLIVKMQVQGLPEVGRWVLYHAPNARVIEPPELAKMVADAARQAARIHSR
jgi:proteasome accessory factor B